nr:hypothetical protein BaRGS_034724 [Batillaria attramentaria]
MMTMEMSTPLSAYEQQPLNSFVQAPLTSLALPIQMAQLSQQLAQNQLLQGQQLVMPFNQGQAIQFQDMDEWGTGLEAMQAALQLEKSINQSLIDLHNCADSHKDSQMCDFLEGEFLKEQVESIKEISDFITNLKRVGPGLGEYQFDKETLQESA